MLHIKDSYWTPTSKLDALELPLNHALNELAVGEVSSVIELKESFTIVCLIGRQDGTPPSFDKATPELTELFIQKQRHTQRNQLLADLWKKSDAHTMLDADWDEYWAKHPANTRRAASP